MDPGIVFKDNVVKVWTSRFTEPYPGTTERAGGETGWRSTDWARPDKETQRLIGCYPPPPPRKKNPKQKLYDNEFLRSNSAEYRVYVLYMCKKNMLYLWLCAAVSRALRGGVGDPCSVTLRTSRLFLSGRQRPWRVSIGESTRFRGGSAEKRHHKLVTNFVLILSFVLCFALQEFLLKNSFTGLLLTAPSVTVINLASFAFTELLSLPVLSHRQSLQMSCKGWYNHGKSQRQLIALKKQVNTLKLQHKDIKGHTAVYL